MAANFLGGGGRFVGMDIRKFLKGARGYAEAYRPWELLEKAGRVGRKLGRKTLYVLLVLYYASFDKSLPVKERLMLAAALGYFILPLDMVPDVLPGGFADDAAALMYVARHVWSHISDKTLAKARATLDRMWKAEEGGEGELKI